MNDEYISIKRSHLDLLLEAVTGGLRVQGLDQVINELLALPRQQKFSLENLWHDPSWLDQIPGKPSCLGKWVAGAGCGEAIWTIDDVDSKEIAIAFTDALKVEVVHPGATHVNSWTVELADYVMAVEDALQALEAAE